MFVAPGGPMLLAGDMPVVPRASCFFNDTATTEIYTELGVMVAGLARLGRMASFVT